MIRIQIAGPLGSDAEVRHIDNGRSAISFSVAHSEKWKDAQGNQQERTTWVRCTIWRKSDQIAIAQYLLKGTKVIAEGAPSARAYTNNQGQAVASLEMTVDKIELMSSPRTQNATVQQQPQQQKPIQTQQAAVQNNSIISNPFGDDDLPF